MALIQLDRQFVTWSDGDRGDPENLRFVDSLRGALDWCQLRQRHRVVILAEAGSGKSSELLEQQRLVSSLGYYSFYATVQNVGVKGIDHALGRTATVRLNEWRGSDQPAWFFVDSVDEAKADGVQLEDALREVAEAISGSEARAHIIISGRHTDWEFRRDLSILAEIIPIPPRDAAVAPVDPNQLVVNTIRRVKPVETPPAEKPLIVVMVALDRRRVEKFAKEKGVKNIDAFFAELEKSSLWDFARRPLDLGWLVEYWQANGKFGSLSEMLELSLRERLQESNMKRARNDALDAERALEALERIGAALVLQRINTIAIPDSGKDLGEVAASLDLSEILPDWSSADRLQLITRPVFDPANAGFVRLHNDNRGAVRSYLTARWLMRLRAKNCPSQTISDLLFAAQYGVDLVKPSMRETAGWLALWDHGVAREIIKRDPRLLMECGDPASLPLDDRRTALGEVISEIANDDTITLPDYDALQRFSAPDMAPFIRDQWQMHSSSVAARELLLFMIELGELKDCADIAVEASFGKYGDRYTQVFSGRALMATANESEKRRYAAYLRDNANLLPASLVWDSIDKLFATHLSVDDLLAMLPVIDLQNSGGGLGLDYHGPRIVARLKDPADIERLLAQLLRMLGSDPQEQNYDDYLGRSPFLSIVEATGRRLLELSKDASPPILAIDAAIRVGIFQHYRGGSNDSDAPNLMTMLRDTPKRRQAALWRAAETLSESKALQEHTPLTNPWQLEIAGFQPGIKTEDLEWLLADAASRQSESNQKLAANIAMRVWREAREPSNILNQIQAASLFIPAVRAVLGEWTTPRALSSEEMEYELRRKQRESESAISIAEQDKSWVKFADDLRANPEQLRELRVPSEEGVDARLYHLWQLLNGIGGNQSRYAIADLSPLRPLMGDPVINELRACFISYWRHWSPRMRSERQPDKRDSVSAMDIIGIVGVTLEAAQDPAWASKLSDDESRKAASYATLELNGFPSWLAALATAKPEPTREIMTRYIALDVSSSAGDQRRDALENLARADGSIVKLIANAIFDVLYAMPAAPPQLLDPALRLVTRGFSDRERLLELLLHRFADAAVATTQAIYIGFAYSIDADRATAELVEALAATDPSTQTLLAKAVLPRIFGTDWSRFDGPIQSLSVANLEQLVLLAYKFIRVQDDNEHPSGKAYTPDERDNAERARSAAFNVLIETPGLATFDAIHRLMNSPGFPISRKRMLDFAHNRAAQDAETGPWTSADVREFEGDFSTAPRMPFDLQVVAMRRLADLQHDLMHADFNQGKVVARLPKEVDVQNWFAHMLRERQGRSYSIEREPHIVEEKEPDLRIRAKATDASLPIEIKIAESWTLEQLEDALTVQLMGRYLRDRNDRWGILLLVHQTTRPTGWRDAVGAWLKFPQLVEHLKAMARSIAAKDPRAPQMQVCVIDVSTAPH